jgi:hypothetical protein
MKLLKNLYGTKQAARNWYLCLSEVLQDKHGFKPSAIDPCIFIRDDCIIALYTDDCCIFGRNPDVISDIKAALAEDFLLRDEGTIEDFLGVRLAFTTDPASPNGLKLMSMTQTGLIDSILDDVGLSQSQEAAATDNPDSDLKVPPKIKHVPAAGPLRNDSDSPPMTAPWNYRSVIGKLNFLAQNTRPDISFSVHQCARFVQSPRKSHEEAVKYLCRYLLKTRDKGMIMRPNGEHRLTTHVDADFCGLFSRDTAHLREASVSRTGYIIEYAGCPIIWLSKLQTEIALSTCEAEYIALSMSMRSLLPMRTLLRELSSTFTPQTPHPTLTRRVGRARSNVITKQLQSYVYEDNQGALEIANQDAKYRPRTKHIAIKWHHFRDQVRSGAVTVKKIGTAVQNADLLTKALPQRQFETLRKLIMGW